MRLLHVVATLNPAKGGPPAVVARLAAAQSTLGHEVAIVAHGHGDDQKAVEHSLAPIPHFSSVDVHFVGNQVLTGLGLPRKQSRHLDELIASFDVAHIHGVWEPILTAAGRSCRNVRRGQHGAGIPYVVTPHGMLGRWALRHGRLKKALALWLTHRRLIQRAGFVHVLNADEGAALQPLKLRPPVRVIGNGVFMEELLPLPRKGSFYESQPQLCGQPYVLFLGRLHPQKGLSLIVDALFALKDRFPDLQVVIAGPDSGAREQVLEQARRLSLERRVHLVGPLYGPAKVAAMVDAACFCLPSEHEAFSVAITEALACGTPVVISHDCHFPQVAEAQAGYIVHRRAEEVARAIESILADSQLRSRMSANGQALVRSRFTWPIIASQMCDEYQRIERPDRVNR